MLKSENMDVEKVIEDLLSIKKLGADGSPAHIKIDNAIQIIRELQIKEEEVCEWEKASEDDMSMWTYYPDCKGMTDIDISGFRYCPYCGRKIKVVE